MLHHPQLNPNGTLRPARCRDCGPGEDAFILDHPSPVVRKELALKHARRAHGRFTPRFQPWR